MTRAYFLITALLLGALPTQAAQAATIDCTSTANRRTFENVICALRVYPFHSGKITGKWRELLRHDAETMRDPAKSIPRIYQLWVSGDREFVEQMWKKKRDRWTRFFIAMLYYGRVQGESEAVTSFTPLSTYDPRKSESLKREEEIELVRKHRSALASEIVEVFQPIADDLRTFIDFSRIARGHFGEELKPGSLDILNASGASDVSAPAR